MRLYQDTACRSHHDANGNPPKERSTSTYQPAPGTALPSAEAARRIKEYGWDRLQETSV
jgi:hypothetical protein